MAHMEDDPQITSADTLEDSTDTLELQDVTASNLSIRTKTISQTRESLRLIQSIEALDEETKSRLQKLLGPYILRSTSDTVRFDAAENVSVNIVGAISVFGLFFGPFLPQWLFPIGSLNFPRYLGSLGVALILGLVGFATFWVFVKPALVLRIFGSKLLVLWGVGGLLVPTSWVVFVATDQASTMEETTRYVLTGGALTFLLYLGPMALLLPVAIVVESLINLRTNRDLPGMAIAWLLTKCLADAESGQFGDIWDARDSFIRRIEESARLLEQELPRRIAMLDTDRTELLAIACSERAEAMRSLKLWVTPPTSKSAVELNERLAKDLSSISANRWSELPTKSLVPVSTLGVLQRIGRILRLTAGAILPAIGLLVLQQTDLALEDPARSYAIAGAIAWVLISVVAAVDPSFSEKVAALKDVSILRPSKRK